MTKAKYPVILPTLAAPGPLTFTANDGLTVTFRNPVLHQVSCDEYGRHEAVLRLLPDADGAVFTVRRPESTPIHDALRKERNL